MTYSPSIGCGSTRGCESGALERGIIVRGAVRLGAMVLGAVVLGPITRGPIVLGAVERGITSGWRAVRACGSGAESSGGGPLSLADDLAIVAAASDTVAVAGGLS